MATIVDDEHQAASSDSTAVTVPVCTPEQHNFCQNAGNQIYDFNIYSEVFGPDSICFMTVIVDSDNNININPERSNGELITTTATVTTASSNSNHDNIISNNNGEDYSFDFFDRNQHKERLCYATKCADDIMENSNNEISTSSRTTGPVTMGASSMAHFSIGSSAENNGKIEDINLSLLQINYRGDWLTCAGENQIIAIPGGTVTPLSIYCPPMSSNVCVRSITTSSTPTDTPTTPAIYSVNQEMTQPPTDLPTISLTKTSTSKNTDDSDNSSSSSDSEALGVPDELSSSRPPVLEPIVGSITPSPSMEVGVDASGHRVVSSSASRVSCRMCNLINAHSFKQIPTLTRTNDVMLSNAVVLVSFILCIYGQRLMVLSIS